jgi:hypothetical protein
MNRRYYGSSEDVDRRGVVLPILVGIVLIAMFVFWIYAQFTLNFEQQRSNRSQMKFLLFYWLMFIAFFVAGLVLLTNGLHNLKKRLGQLGRRHNFNGEPIVIRRLSRAEQAEVDKHPESILVTTWNRSEVKRFNSVVAYLMQADRLDDAVTVVRANPSAVRYLPAEYQDNEVLMLAAMRKNLAPGSFASPRIREDLEFFLSALKSFLGRPDAGSGSARDVLFLLDWARHYRFYDHLIGSHVVFARFSSTPKSRDEDALSVRLLVQRCSNFDWYRDDNVARLEFLRDQCPGFSTLSYELASDWASSNRSRELSKLRNA